MGSGANAVITLGFTIVCLHCGLASDTSLRPVTNVTWTSFNFRTTLQWETTSKDSVYSVRIHGIQTDWKRKPECTRIKTTSCDLTSLMQNVTDKYVAEVSTHSATPRDEVEEPPFAKSPSIQLLSQTIIGGTKFKLIEKSKTEVQVLIEDTVTSIKFSNNTPKTLHDIFGASLKYKVTSWKDGTSGKKTEIINSSKALIKVDEGFSYCFSIQIWISPPSKYGLKSQHICTNVQNTEYGIGFYALITIIALVVFSIIIGVTVCLCRRKSVHSSTETNPLKAVSV
ncbi:tissue factor-like [Carcharodon carcharias]|uniref:tissue factor-like n=1 Tax=Carcharodon carcharias TaxID=13397 RepID=UPI001B7DA41A|nr:tissue factor-like [Carcharodon carcharias]